VGHPIVTNVILCVRGGDAALPKLLWDFFLPLSLVTVTVCPQDRHRVNVVLGRKEIQCTEAQQQLSLRTVRSHSSVHHTR